ncbi:MAG: lipopolysaccharide heptosyltransferase II, partial [Sedimentisphaerales bacterium]|nr:lipopolysaccharide heptosyltransferase II [Sedimentisphaerales bacterium]
MTEKARNILVVLPRPLGDAVMALAALKKLRQAFPQARISVFGFASTCEVLEHHPDVDARIPAKMNNTGKFKLWSGIKQLRKTSFDVAVLLNNSFRSALLVRLSGIKHAVGYRREGRGILLHHAITPFRLVGEYAPLAMAHYYQRLIHHAIIQWGGQNAYNDAHETGKLYIGPDDETGADRLLEKWNISKTDKRVMLVPGGAFGPSKYWPVFRWAQLADKLVEAEKCRVVLCCTPNIDEQNIAQAIQTHAHNRIYNLGEHSVSLGVLKALIQGCTLIVAHDTGPVHIAAALGTPVVTLFGPTDPRWTAANYKREIRLHHPEACPPCQNPYC